MPCARSLSRVRRLTWLARTTASWRSSPVLCTALLQPNVSEPIFYAFKFRLIRIFRRQFKALSSSLFSHWRVAGSPRQNPPPCSTHSPPSPPSSRSGNLVSCEPDSLVRFLVLPHSVCARERHFGSLQKHTVAGEVLEWGFPLYTGLLLLLPFPFPPVVALSPPFFPSYTSTAICLPLEVV